MAQTRTSQTRSEIAMTAAQDAVRASIEAAQKIADCSMDAGSEAARKVQIALKEALDALRPGNGAAKATASPSRRSA